MTIPTIEPTIRRLRGTMRELLYLAEQHPEQRDRFRSEAVGVAIAIQELRKT